jgi:hypothetical protein
MTFGSLHDALVNVNAQMSYTTRDTELNVTLVLNPTMDQIGIELRNVRPLFS